MCLPSYMIWYIIYDIRYKTHIYDIDFGWVNDQTSTIIDHLKVH